MRFMARLPTLSSSPFPKFLNTCRRVAISKYLGNGVGFAKPRKTFNLISPRTFWSGRIFHLCLLAHLLPDAAAKTLGWRNRFWCSTILFQCSGSGTFFKKKFQFVYLWLSKSNFDAFNFCLFQVSWSFSPSPPPTEQTFPVPLAGLWKWPFLGITIPGAQ